MALVTRLSIGALLCALTMAAALAIGSSSIDLGALWALDPIVVHVRLPRVVLGALCGLGLAGAGVAFQAILRNALADPYIVGVSGGAALGGVIALALGATSPLSLPFSSFLGAALAVILLLAMAKHQTTGHPDRLLLIGVVFNAFAAAVVTLIKTLVDPDRAHEILFWLMGSLDAPPTALLVWLTLYIAVGIIVLLRHTGTLNLLTLGDDEAAALGVSVGRVRMQIYIAASLLVGAVVSVAGMIGFVGLVVPHIVRLLVGAEHRVLLPASLFGGAIFLVIADTVSRATFLAWQSEIPVGAITAFVGGPFFLYLLLRPRSAGPSEQAP